jgi:hypothetical protein
MSPGDGPESVAEVTGSAQPVAHRFDVARQDGGLWCLGCGTHAREHLVQGIFADWCAICLDNLAHTMAA